MEGEPKKTGHNQAISEDDASKNKDNEKSSSKRPSRRFRDFLAGGNLEESEPTSTKISSESPQVSPEPKKSSENFKEKSKGKDGDKKEDKGSTEVHELHFSQELMKFDIYRKLRSNKEKVIKITGGIIGALFIIAGIVYIMGAAFRVADNVIFGERAVFSAFLVLVGVLILAGIFARSLLEGSFLKNIHNELEVAEDQPSTGKPSDKSSNKKEKQKGNIDKKDKE